MKEFIEKLIGGVEEIPVGFICCECPNILKCNEIEDSGMDKNVDLCGATIKQLAIETVNQLAEEYNNDFCEWKMFKANARLRHKNCMFAEDTVDPWKFNFCPYCGKKIKIAPYQPKGE